MDVEVAVVDVDVPAEDVADERQDGRVVDEVEERVVEAEEGEPVQHVAVRRLGPPDALDGGGQPRDGSGLERVPHDDEAVPVEVFPPHVAIYGRGRGVGPQTDLERSRRPAPLETFEGGASPPEASSSVWPPPHRGRPVTCRVAPAASGPSLSTLRSIAMKYRFIYHSFCA